MDLKGSKKLTEMRKKVLICVYGNPICLTNGNVNIKIKIKICGWKVVNIKNRK